MDLTVPTANGTVHPAYTQDRAAVADMVPPQAYKVLDVGCSVGNLGALLRRRGHCVTGIEVDPELADLARGRLERVVEADVEDLARQRPDIGQPYSCVVFADVLEHLRNPWVVVQWAAQLLDERGVIVLSVPNIRHIRLIRQVLLARRWPYDEVGVFDRTHLRWFAYHNLAQLVEGTGMEIVDVRRYHALSADPRSRRDHWGNRLAPLLGDFGTLQFLARAERPLPAEALPSPPGARRY